MEAVMVPKSSAAPKPSTVDVPPVQQPAGMAEAHNKVILDAARAGDMFTDAANMSGDRLGMVSNESVSADKDTGRKNRMAGAAFSDMVRRCSSAVGIAVTSTAATALAVGTPTPATGFALLLGGLSLVSDSVVGGGGGSGHGCHGDHDDDGVSLA